MIESVVLCEGYHDRAFWAGWLERLGCVDLARSQVGSGRIDVRDPWDKPVTRGEFGFHSRSDRFVRLVPCHGKANLLKETRTRLRDEQARLVQGAVQARLDRLVVSIDADVSVDGEEAATGFRHADLTTIARQFDPAAAQGPDGDLLLFGAATAVSLVRWEAPDEPAPGLPAQQTLERLVCAAVVAAYPGRGPAVQNWLDARPDAPGAGPKEFGWSHMAGWYAERGCESFFRAVWEDDRICAELEARLRNSGAWRIGEALAQ